MIKKRWLVVKYFIVIFIIVFISLLSNFFRYNDSSIINYELLYQENKILKEELESVTSFSYDNYILGKVLYRDMYSFYEEIVINLGDDDVAVGDGVINEVGLIGVIYKVESKVSYVKLLSSDYNVSVLVNGMYGNLNNGMISLLDKYSDIKEGDLVYTANYGSLEDGIYVGKVKKVLYDENLLGKEALIELVDNKNLNYIGVVKKIK